VPEEFAAAYQEAYERALAEQKRGEQAATGAHRAHGHWPHGHRDRPHRGHEPEGAEETAPLGGAHADRGTGEDPAEGLGVGGLVGEPIEEPEPEPAGTATDEGWTEYAVPSAFDTFRSSWWFVPALLVLAVLVLVLGAYGVGRIFATGVDEAAPVAGETGTPTVPASDPSASGQPTSHSSRATHRPPKPKQTGHRAPAVWKGPVSAVAVASAQAGCTAPSSVDAAGHPVTYEAANAIDGRADTTWRCPGKAIGKTLVLHLGDEVAVGAVGLVPGYAKTDPVSGANRYAENNRITEVRWALGDGRTVVQHLSGSAADRSLRSVRVPRTETDTITLQVLAVQEGPRDTTCVSEVRVARAG
jgi:hypothetical protein